MSTVAAPLERARSRWLALRVSADALAVGGIAAIIALLVPLTWGTWGDPGSDTGYDIVAGARFADGEVPYADYIYYYGPLSPALLALATVLGGDGVGSAVALGVVLAAAIVFATYAVARTLTGPLGAFLAAALTAPVAFAPNNFSFVLPHSDSATLGILAALLFLLAVGRYAASGSASWLLVAGASTGLVTLTRPEFVVAVGAAAVLWLALRVRARVSARRELLLFAAPALTIPAAVYGAFLAAASPTRLVLDNLYPVDTLNAGANAVYKAYAPLTAESFAELGGKLLIYAAGALALVLAARVIESGRVPRRLLLGLAIAAGFAIVVASLARSETLRYGLEFAYGWIPAGAAIATGVVLWRFHRRGDGWSVRSQVELAVLVVLTVLAAKTYAAFLVHAPEAQLAVYAVPFAALFLARLHLHELAPTRTALTLGCLWLAFLAAAGVGLTLKDARAESSVIRGPGGALEAEPREAAVYGAALSWLLANTGAGERVLVAPQLTWMYTLAERESPLEQISLHPGALPSAEDERDAIAQLEASGVRAVVIDRREFPEYGHTSFGGSFDRTLAGWIRRTFEREAVFGGGADAPTLEAWLKRRP